MAERIGKDAFEEKVLRSGRPVVEDFYSDSCMACKKLSQALAQTEEALKGSGDFYKVNTVYEEELAEQYEIMALPTLVVFAGGEEKDRRTGAYRGCHSRPRQYTYNTGCMRQTKYHGRPKSYRSCRQSASRRG